MPSFLYSVIAGVIILWSIVLFILFRIPPQGILIISLFLLILFLALTLTLSLLIFFIKRNKINAPQRHVYRSNFKWAVYIALFIVLVLISDLLIKHFVLKSL
jgi:hypothetical protein